MRVNEKKNFQQKNVNFKRFSERQMFVNISKFFACKFRTTKYFLNPNVSHGTKSLKLIESRQGWNVK